MPEPKSPKSRRQSASRRRGGSSRKNDLPVGPASDQQSDRSPEGTNGDVDRGSGRPGRQEGVESVPREGEVGETGGRQADGSADAPRQDESDGPAPQDEVGATPEEKGRQHDEPAPQDARKIVDERQRIRETGHYGKI